MTELLRLRAESADDLPALSALVQDMTVKAAAVGWDGRRLVLMGNRYRWEASETHTRSHSALRFEYVERVERRMWPGDPSTVLALLALTLEGNVLTIAFAAGPTLRAHLETLDATLEDIVGPWGASAVPDHS